MSTSPRIWLITGANSGFGRAMLDHVLAQGETAIAAVRRPETLASLQKEIGDQRLLVVKLDVTQSDQITAAFKEIKDKFGRIDVLYNNAGFPNAGQVEGVAFEEARELFETNFWGATAVARATVEFMRETNKPSGGRILQMASMFGATTDPCTGYYSASKHALEAISAALAKELEPEWNIKVTTIEPGYFLTDGMKARIGTGTNTNDIIGHPAYTGVTAAILNAFQTTDPALFIKGDPVKLSAAVYKASSLEDPPLWLPLGKDAHKQIRENLERHLADLDKYKEWTYDLDF